MVNPSSASGTTFTQQQMQAMMSAVSGQATNGLNMSASETMQEGQAAVNARLAGHAVAQMGKALDALDKAII